MLKADGKSLPKWLLHNSDRMKSLNVLFALQQDIFLDIPAFMRKAGTDFP